MLNSRNKVKAALVLIPTVIVVFYFIWGFAVYTAFLSFTKSRFLPNHEIIGFDNYILLFANDRWWVAYSNMFIFGALYIGGCIILGALLAVLLDRLTKGETLFRTIFLYPMSLSLVVTGLAWQWILNPDFGLQGVIRDFGWESFSFDPLNDPETVMFGLLISGLWQGTGLIMVILLAGLRGIDAVSYTHLTLPTILLV